MPWQQVGSTGVSFDWSSTSVFSVPAQNQILSWVLPSGAPSLQFTDVGLYLVDLDAWRTIIPQAVVIPGVRSFASVSFELWNASRQYRLGMRLRGNPAQPRALTFSRWV